MSADWISPTADARWHTSVYIWYNVECKPTAAVNSGLSQQQSTPAPSATFPSSCSAANHSSITGPAAAHSFTSRLSVLAVSTAPAGARDSEWPTVADSGRLRASEPGCLPSFLPSSRPLCSHQEMSFSSSVSSALYSASLSNNKDRIERRKKKIPPLLVTTEFTSFVSHQWHPCLSRMHISVRTAMLHTLLFHIWDTFLTEIWI